MVVIVVVVGWCWVSDGGGVIVVGKGELWYRII